MALTKPAQKFKCVARNVPITGTEHSAAFRAEYDGRPRTFVGTKLALFRDDSNRHDRFAVQVRKNMSNEFSQMGWIGMRTGHSEKIGKLMDALPDLYGSHIVVTSCKHSIGPPVFYGDVYLPDYGEPEPDKDPPLCGRRVSHLVSQKGSSVPIDLTPYIGKVLLLATTPSRVSVTLQAANGDRLGWFRKSGLDDIDDWTVKRALVKGKSMIDLIDKSALQGQLTVVPCEVQVGALMPNVRPPTAPPPMAPAPRLHLTESEVRLHYSLAPGDTLRLSTLHRAWLVQFAGEECWRMLTPVDQLAPDFRLKRDFSDGPRIKPALETLGSISPHLDDWSVRAFREGKTAEIEQQLREGLRIPNTLQLQTGDDQQIWRISEDGEHWLHLIDQPFSPANAAVKHAQARRYAFEQFESHYPADFYLRKQQNQTTETQPQKEATMTTNFAQKFTAVVNSNKSAATTAAYLEAGRIGTNQLAKLAGKHLPMMLRGYADTAVGKLVIANIAVIAAKQLRPNDETLNELTEAMQVAAFQEVYQSFDIEGFVDGLLESPEMKKAVAKLPKKTAAAE